MNTIWIVLPILTVLMFDLGLCLKLQDFARVVKAPKAVLLALFGQIVLLPLIAWGLGSLFHLEPVFFLGIILIACCPGGSSSNIFSKLAGGDVALSVTLTACSSLITLFTVPLIMAWSTQSVGEAVGITLPVGNLLKQNLLLMLLPVLIGIGVTLLILISAGAASLLSHLFRLGVQARRTITIEVGMQNAAQAIAVASSPFIFANEQMAIPAILYSLMMNVVLLTYVVLVRSQNS